MTTTPRAPTPADTIKALRDALAELCDMAEQCDSWESFPQAPIDKARTALADASEDAPDEPFYWLEAEASARGRDPRDVFGRHSMLYSTNMSRLKPTGNNPCWPLYLHPAAPVAEQAKPEPVEQAKLAEGTAELCQWLRDHSSGAYRQCAEAADLIERLAGQQAGAVDGKWQRLLKAASTYANNWCQDEAEPADDHMDMVCSPAQHADAVEFVAAIAAVSATHKEEGK